MRRRKVVILSEAKDLALGVRDARDASLRLSMTGAAATPLLDSSTRLLTRQRPERRVAGFRGGELA
ncbi:MAG TPA: hypothetical protein VFU81_15050, partial [Thermomicrobiales bacterium]|nr:hypothetical protein [Thermomicrobiales bacterium]